VRQSVAAQLLAWGLTRRDVLRMWITTAMTVGSANLDWRSLTQIKEFGIYFPNAPVVASELAKVGSPPMQAARHHCFSTPRR